jgi:uncharacterized membrane protein
MDWELFILLHFFIITHILSAIILIIPTVIIPLLVKYIKTLPNLKRLFKISNLLSRFSKLGGIILFVSGFGIMWAAKIGFSQMWLNVSIILVVILEIIAALIAPKKMKSIGNYILAYQGREIPKEFNEMMKEITPYNGIIHLITIAIMLLMIFKPF